ncbi:hypothetical protein MVES1_002599 [Malassezia vespertilionis]|uniref:Major facilitator superfamily (MFS) profile domain-containing protein n=1 Tax=Malassezia vespertilionis TaxID=2020962 RepID=A0A2N1JAN6_9BASI|nr:uncharacterized protein MVES1_002599 [Malassezia vespertilionis]PKI83616.1 hypothetical protein MVES_002453 [Malassezia vespertilionis]WFD07239.1 hypothetical protein MVES1_002599 [Malassezia vespertilionis]
MAEQDTPPRDGGVFGNDVFAVPPDQGSVDAGVFFGERARVDLCSRAKSAAGPPRAKRASRPARQGANRSSAPQLHRGNVPDMMSWSMHIEAVNEETPLISLRTGHQRKRRKAVALLVLYASLFIMALSVSLDSMSFTLYLNYACSEFNALSSMGTVMIVQQLVRAVAKPPFARLSDLLGRILTLVLVLVLYALGYAVMASAASFNMLLWGMIIQSFGMTGVQVLLSIIIADTTSVQWRGLLIATVNVPYLVNFALTGPLVEFVLRTSGWRFGLALWVAVVPISALPLLITLFVGYRRALQMGTGERAPPSTNVLREMDLLGMGLFSSALTLILLPMSLGGLKSYDRYWSTGNVELIGGLVLLCVFGVWETYASSPFLPYKALSNFTILAVCLIAALDFSGFYLSWTYLAPFIMILKDWNQMRTAFFVSAQNVTSTLTGILVGMVMAYTRRLKHLMVVGFAVRILGVALMIHYRSMGHAAITLVFCQILQGIGGGSVAVTTQVAAQVAAPPSKVAVVTAFELLTTEVGAAFGSALASAVFTSLLPRALEKHLPYMPHTELDRIEGDLSVVLQYPYGSVERTDITLAWADVMRVLCIVSCFVQLPGLLIAFCVPNMDLHDQQTGARPQNDAQPLAKAPSLRRDAGPVHVHTPPWHANESRPGTPVSYA